MPGQVGARDDPVAGDDRHPHLDGQVLVLVLAAAEQALDDLPADGAANEFRPILGIEIEHDHIGAVIGLIEGLTTLQVALDGGFRDELDMPGTGLPIWSPGARAGRRAKADAEIPRPPPCGC